MRATPCHETADLRSLLAIRRKRRERTIRPHRRRPLHLLHLGSFSKSPTTELEWTKRRAHTSSNHFLRRRRRAKALVLDFPPSMALSVSPADTFRFTLSSDT